jgi:SnoaL-like protein
MCIRWLRIVGAVVLAFVASGDVTSGKSAPPEAPEIAEFRAFLDKLHEAHEEFINGRPAAFKALWSHRPDVTIFGGFGSGELGWGSVGPRLDWASAQFSDGTRSREVVSTVVTGELGYVVQIERVRFKVPGQSTRSLLELRVTMIARREPEGWRIVHRHADSQMAKQPPR